MTRAAGRAASSQAIVPHAARTREAEVRSASLAACLQDRLRAAGSLRLPVKDWMDDAPLPPGEVRLGAIKEAWKAALKALQKAGHLRLCNSPPSARSDVGAWVVHLLNRQS